MAIRKTPLVNNEYYHVFNRGTDKRTIFTSIDEVYFFTNRLIVLNSLEVNSQSSYKRNTSKKYIVESESGNELVKVVAYCLLPNHFHLILKQQCENGISKFMQRLGSAYVTLFNQKHQRSGSLFQGRFKAKHISGEQALPIMSSYVNLNYKHHKINPKENLVKSSIFEYIGTELGECICDKNEVNKVVREVGGIEKYQAFAKNASIAFAQNKDIQLTDMDFDF